MNLHAHPCPATLNIFGIGNTDRCELEHGHDGRHSTLAYGHEITWARDVNDARSAA